MSEAAHKGYEFFEHTADTGMRAYGKTLPELFDRAAKGLVALLVEDGQIRAKEQRPIALTATSIEGMLEQWLRELLFWFSTDRFLPACCTFDSLSSRELRGVVQGEPFDAARHRPGTEVKGVTYHQFRVEQTTTGWQAEVIFDV